MRRKTSLKRHNDQLFLVVFSIELVTFGIRLRVFGLTIFSTPKFPNPNSDLKKTPNLLNPNFSFPTVYTASRLLFLKLEISNFEVYT